MLKLPRTALSPVTVANVHANIDLLVKHVITRMPSIHVRTGPIIKDPAVSIATTTLYTTQLSINESGHFRVVATLINTRAGTGGTVSVLVSWNNGSGFFNVTSANLVLNSLGAEIDLIQTFYVGAGQNITYSTNVIGAAGNPTYSLNIKLEFLS